MRYCPCCKRLNLGRPVICYYCGKSWNVRLCSGGHANPPDAKVCGTCGKVELTSTAGSFPRWMKAMVVTFVVLFVMGMVHIVPQLIVTVAGELLPVLMPMLLIIVAASWFLPASVKNGVAKWCTGALRLLGRIIRFVLFGREQRSRGRRA